MIDFPHLPPEGFSYSFESFNARYDAVWIINHAEFSYRDTPPKSIWGFYSSESFSARYGAVWIINHAEFSYSCLLYTSPSPRDRQKSRMPSSA